MSKFFPLDQIPGLMQIGYMIESKPNLTPPWAGNPTTGFAIQQGTIVNAVSPYWGAGEFMFVKASAAIRQGGLVMLAPAFNSNTQSSTNPFSPQWEFLAAEVPNTANLGAPLGVAVQAFAGSDWGWVQVGGLAVMNCNASVAAATTLGIAAAGQGGANGAGKQILNARVAAAATTTVVKTNCYGDSGSTIIKIPNADGLFPGAYISGTGVGAAATIVSISNDGLSLVSSVANSSAVSGSVTATYNNATVFYNVVQINRPFAQGAIT